MVCVKWASQAAVEVGGSHLATGVVDDWEAGIVVAVLNHHRLSLGRNLSRPHIKAVEPVDSTQPRQLISSRGTTPNVTPANVR